MNTLVITVIEVEPASQKLDLLLPSQHWHRHSSFPIRLWHSFSVSVYLVSIS